MNVHLPILQVLVPLMAAPIAALVRRRGAAWLISVIATWATFGIAVSLRRYQCHGMQAPIDALASCFHIRTIEYIPPNDPEGTSFNST